MDMQEFSVLNKHRCESENGFNHSMDSWSMSDWMTATLGELGEAANVVKKLNRVRDNILGNGEATETTLKEMLQDEIADTFIYLDLFAQAAGFDLAAAVIAKFDKTSEKIGFNEKIRNG